MSKHFLHWYTDAKIANVKFNKELLNCSQDLKEWPKSNFSSGLTKQYYIGEDPDNLAYIILYFTVSIHLHGWYHLSPTMMLMQR